jgi:hypothetical protein
MRSLRLEEALEKRIELAAAREGVSVSEFIRRAAAERADVALAGPTNAELLADVIGVVDSGPGHEGDASRASEIFGQHVVDKHDSQTWHQAERQVRDAGT